LRRGIYVPLPSREREALLELADSEWRSPREQAAKFVVEGLRQAGALPSDTAHRANKAAVGHK
jgi:hypothetical protein